MTAHAARDPVLLYFADPMCSWCWGFSPVIEAIRREYRERIKLALVLGGLRPGVTEAMTPALRAEMLQHWQAVEERSGQPFTYQDALPAGFVYDTEPASRAVISLATLHPGETFPYFKTVQAAFYVHQRDVTQAETLALLAQEHGVDAQAFLEAFESAAIRLKTRQHFQRARDLGVRSFPTLVLQDQASIALLSNGYRGYQEIRPEIEAWLAA